MSANRWHDVDPLLTSSWSKINLNMYCYRNKIILAGEQVEIISTNLDGLS